MELYFIYFLLYSFIGFILETSYVYLMDKKWVQRGFLFGPVIPIYGFGAIAIILGLSSFKDQMAHIFIFGILLTSTLEYITSYVMEKLFDMRWWDYSQRKYNIKGRICLRNSLIFGVLSLVLIQWIHPFTIQKVQALNSNSLTSFASLGFVLIMIDWTWSTLEVLNFKKYIQDLESLRTKALEYRKELNLSGNIKDFMNLQDEILDEKFKDLKRQIKTRYSDFYDRQQRLLTRFPHVTSKRYHKILERIKERNKK